MSQQFIASVGFLLAFCGHCVHINPAFTAHEMLFTPDNYGIIVGTGSNGRNNAAHWALVIQVLHVCHLLDHYHITTSAPTLHFQAVTFAGIVVVGVCLHPQTLLGANVQLVLSTTTSGSVITLC